MQVPSASPCFTAASIRLAAGLRPICEVAEEAQPPQASPRFFALEAGRPWPKERTAMACKHMQAIMQVGDLNEAVLLLFPSREEERGGAVRAICS